MSEVPLNIPPAMPERLTARAQKGWAALLERVDDELVQRLAPYAGDAEQGSRLARMLACSEFFDQTCRAHPALLAELLESGDLDRALPDTAFTEALDALATTDLPIETVLRRFRRRHQLRVIWRDFNRLADTRETVRDMSLLADACITRAARHAQEALETRFGTPRGRRSGKPQQLIVIALGKLGARELNVSSDIDLMFSFPEAGETDGEQRNLSNEEFFTRVGRSLINLLDAVNAEGFVFRVDMRLRPYGESGALVHNFAALEEYYQDQGREWERYALIKARPVTGEPQDGAVLLRMLRPFVYRRYVDFGVIESLRGMKRMIVDEVRRRGLENNVKLGSGGIREIEFIAQCFQLIRGGRDRELQQPELASVMPALVELGCLPAAAVTDLEAAYLFLRDTEHAVQGYRDQQTQELPTDEDARLALAYVMGFTDYASFQQALAAHRDGVTRHFDALIAERKSEHPAPSQSALWSDELSAETLEALGYRTADTTLEALATLRDSHRLDVLQTEGRERLEQFMPRLIESCADVEHPDLALQRILPLVTAIMRRSAYLALLLENPMALQELVALCHASPWIAEQMTRHPALLDELLDRASLYTAPDRDRLSDELRQQVTRIPMEDLETHMEALRYFKASQVLRVAASELAGRLPLMKVSDKLTFIAEVSLEHALQLAWSTLTAKYGEPARDGDGLGFAVIAYGKLGGLELGYGSDLDLVFIYDASKSGVTSGERAIDNSVFYTRLGQRIIHILETRMALGQLYEVDMRLRPSGNSGMLVSSLGAFHSYQRDSAWTWEHQALVRARFVAGDPAVGDAVDAVRREVLGKTRDEAALAEEVIGMRRRMREHLLDARSEKEGLFDLKQGRGGIVDIEFMVQYAVLAWASRTPGLARWSDNIRILESLGSEGLFSAQACDQLKAAYIAYRSASHQLALQQQPQVVPAGEFAAHREIVQAHWIKIFSEYETQLAAD